MSSEKNSFEKKMQRLEEIVNILENEELGIEESLQLFQEGMKIGKECKEFLKKLELKVNKILEVNEDGTLTSEPFDE
ncbi:exodeoxyribonuclease VII small subunit [Deferribacter autotrophicus]|uniref:Exodeoxyribonuclease 7 small subunit n=1 Tax=Deferribacter autotrophicus TaxID=500465 RepID=A0A5A8F4V4_9BACT|nr:exodeoxyribonuclease VII small subunit [Deferribacter autotrophicus]KAA0259159.1 exodeoxyribonuclease VII small subunit [Deferribacter autotrophicus]